MSVREPTVRVPGEFPGAIVPLTVVAPPEPVPMSVPPLATVMALAVFVPLRTKVPALRVVVPEEAVTVPAPRLALTVPPLRL